MRTGRGEPHSTRDEFEDTRRSTAGAVNTVCSATHRMRLLRVPIRGREMSPSFPESCSAPLGSTIRTGKLVGKHVLKVLRFWQLKCRTTSQALYGPYR